MSTPIPGLAQAQDERALRFQQSHARALRALAYRMLGSRAEAEDVVQDAWLRWSTVDEATVQHAGAFLSRLVTHLCLDRLKSAAAQRERYVGVWLPEPLVDEAAGWCPGPEAQAEYAQDVSTAFLLALQRLSPLERAAFLLHDVFDLDFDEIGNRLQRSPAACRQLASRARSRVRAGEARQTVQTDEHQRLLAAFIQALQQQDVAAMAQVLTDDAVLLADGGGKVNAVPRALSGGGRVAKALVGFTKLPGHLQWRLQPAWINGEPGYVAHDAQGLPVQTVVLRPADAGRIAAVYIQRNPDKLRHLRPLPPA